MIEDSVDLARIRRFGLILHRFILGLLWLAPVLPILLVMWKGPLALVTIPSDIQVDYTALGYPAALLIIAVGMLTPATFFIGFMYLSRLFRLYSQGVVFSERNVLLIRRCGYVLMAVDGVRMLKSALTGPVLTALGAVDGYLAIEIGMSTLVIGLAIVLISHVMALGCKLHENDRLTI